MKKNVITLMLLGVGLLFITTIFGDKPVDAQERFDSSGRENNYPSLTSVAINSTRTNETKSSGMKSPYSPIITAFDRRVKQNDPNFNIMDGVIAYDYLGKDITSRITVEGAVDIHTLGKYPITYHVTDEYGNSAINSINITVEEASTTVTPPILDEVTDTDKTITGTATPGTKVYLILGTSAETYRGIVQADGTFMVPLDTTYPAGTSITAYCEDDQGNQSEDVYAVVQGGKLTVGVDEIVSSDTSVTGYTKPSAKIEVAVDNTFKKIKPREHIFTGIADVTGKYVVDMHGFSYPAGTKIIVTATLNGKSSSKSVIVYPKKVSIDTAKAGDQSIYGEADPGATVKLAIGSENYQFIADEAGHFHGNLNATLKTGDRIIATQVSNNIESDQIIVYIDQ